MSTTDSLRVVLAGWIPAGILALALVIGGGGSPAPLPELVLQIAVAALALTWWWAAPRPLAAAPAALTIAAVLLLLPLVQLIPLPPALWQALPGRDAARDALDLTGHAQDWRPLALAPQRTLAALLAAIPAALMLLMAGAADRRGRLRLVATLALGGAATMVLGAAQVSGGPAGSLRFYGGGATFLEGFQANHNSTADVLLIGMIAAVAWIRERALRRGAPAPRAAVLGLAGAVTAVLGLGVVLTASRMGMALLPVALIAAALLLRPWLSWSPRTLGAGLAIVAAAGLIGALALSRNDMLGRIGDRFNLTAEQRPDLWADSLYAAKSYFPAGVGMGNFVPALLANERLEVVQAAVPNRAHNDYLELLVEAGVAGMAALSIAATALARALWQARRDPPAGSGAFVVVGGMALLVLALHSLVDYPLRSMSIALAAAACAGIAMPLRVARVRQDQSVRLEDT
ncbi:MAG: O-antigen ligase family protein [Novosphingobium sp.]